MSVDFLDIMDIRAVFQKMRRKRVTQRMGRNIFIDFCAFGILLQQLPEPLPGHPITVDVDEQRTFVRMDDQ